MSQSDAVRQALYQLKDEHRTIMESVRAVLEAAASPEGTDIVPLLESLHGTLARHFAHEEYPEGLYDRMGACTADHRDELRELVDEHFRLLSMLRGMIERARLGERERLADEARAFAEQLRDHETKEHALGARLAAPGSE
ncbi:MAG: hypothetical protein Kow0062_20120 [Acidobacteriota bacterium]